MYSSDCSLRSPEQALGLEWLETNGLGGYASSTAACCNTRRYHGLLVVCPSGEPSLRMVILSKLEDRLECGPEVYELSCNIYGQVMHPLGYKYLESFAPEPWPTWKYAAGDCVLRKEILMPHGANCVVVRYELASAPHPVWLCVRPLFAGRDYHHLRQAASEVPAGLEAGGGQFELVVAEGVPPCRMVYPGGEFLADGLWYYNFHYPVERARGLDYVEDLYSPGEIRWLVAPGSSVHLVATTDEDTPDVAEAFEAEAKRRAALVQVAPEGDSHGRRLVRAADQFIIRRRFAGRTVPSIIAGYPWFADWGRDALIALPGLLISTGRLDEAAEVLEFFCSAMHNGLVPNCFLDGQPGYNSVDATLWLFTAARLLAAAGRTDFVVSSLYPALVGSMEALFAGTDFDIKADRDGLLRAGRPDTQLTWMDACVDGRPVTPRWHKPVEVQALWHAALRTMEYLSTKAGDEGAAKRYAAAARRARKAFFQAFWDPGRGYLADCVLPDDVDETLRPNQVIALSLPYKLVSDSVARSVIRVVEDKLLTPYGLRTLPPDHPAYHASYAGGAAERDAAYHQGTVWPWLMGPYLRAKLALDGQSAQMRLWARQQLTPLLEHLDAACIGQISEVFDAEPPHAPRGCFAQAWSVAEVLRVWIDFRLGELD